MIDDNDDLFGKTHFFKPNKDFLEEYTSTNFQRDHVRLGSRGFGSSPQFSPQQFSEQFKIRLENAHVSSLKNFESFRSYAKYLYRYFDRKYGPDGDVFPKLILDKNQTELTKYYAFSILNNITNLFSHNFPKFSFLDKAINDIIENSFYRTRIKIDLIQILRGFLDDKIDLDELFSQSASPAKYRRRSDLPDPDKPAWAEVNRKPRSKTQVNLRLEDELQDIIAKAAQKKGISRTEWMTNAFVNQAQAEGWDTPTISSSSPSAENTSTRPKHHQRKAEAFPDPTKPASAEINRRDTAITLRINPAMLAAIDQDAERHGMERIAWFREAAELFLASKQELPSAEGKKAALSKVIGLRFDPDLLEAIDHQADASNVTRADWLRRVAQRQLETQRYSPNFEATPAP